MSERSEDETQPILTSTTSYFEEMVSYAISERQVEVTPLTSQYLVELLDFYVLTENLTQSSSLKGKKQTLAEMYLKAANSEANVRFDLMKKLGDTSLYISGFFGDSLRRKVVDIDYYVDMGCAAYGSLADANPETPHVEVYGQISAQFMDFVDVLTIISQKALVQSNKDLLRLYDRYVTTGSELAKDQLIEQGLLTVDQAKKASNQ